MKHHDFVSHWIEKLLGGLDGFQVIVVAFVVPLVPLKFTLGLLSLFIFFKSLRIDWFSAVVPRAAVRSPIT